MSYSQLRVKLVVAAGVVGASLLAATFVGCQTSPTSQAQNGPFGQYNGNQFAGAPNGQAPSPYGSSPQMASAGGPVAGWNPQSQQAFMNETQRLGTQQNLTAQDVVAMARSGVPDQQIAMAITQRGENLRATPGMSQFLAQNGVNPAVLGSGAGPAGSVGQPAGFPASYGGQVAANDPQTAFAGSPAQSRPVFSQSQPSGVMPAGYPAAQPEAGQVQTATNDPSLASPSLDQSAAAANGMNGQNWRPMPH
jgi:pyruvate/2-oxoglutarate dehydrogenase complex dihydrolipoamide acyltransferase (E2) component